MSVEVPKYVLQSLFNTFEAQCSLIKGLLDSQKDDASQPQPIVAQSSIGSIPVVIKNSVENKLDYTELENKIEHLIFEKITLEKELEKLRVNLIIQSDIPGEFERGFNEGLKAAKQEEVINQTDSKNQRLQESSEKQDDKKQNVVVEVSAPVVPNLESLEKIEYYVKPEIVQVASPPAEVVQVAPPAEAEVVQVAPPPAEVVQVAPAEVVQVPQVPQVAESQSQSDAAEDEQQDQEEESPEFEEFELNGQTYYLNTQTFKFYIPSDDGEIDEESPAGYQDPETGKCRFYRSKK